MGLGFGCFVSTRGRVTPFFGHGRPWAAIQLSGVRSVVDGLVRLGHDKKAAPISSHADLL
jgi:hypothetical protein